VTFLFTDIEGSTRRWEEDPEAMRSALALHDEVLRSAIEAQDGWLFKHTGDGVCAAFGSARAAVDAAVVAQRELGLPVRMGVATGEAEEQAGDYFGPALNRAARVMAAGHGGQILVAASTASLVDGVDLIDLGEHRLRDLAGATRLFQVRAEGVAVDFPRLRTIETVPGNLPVQVTSFVGRDVEVKGLIESVRAHRLVTLTGVGKMLEVRVVGGGLHGRCRRSDPIPQRAVLRRRSGALPPPSADIAPGPCWSIGRRCRGDPERSLLRRSHARLRGGRGRRRRERRGAPSSVRNGRVASPTSPDRRGGHPALHRSRRLAGLPWPEVAMRSDFAQFKRDVESWTLTAARESLLRDAVARVFTGQQTTPPDGGVAWDRGVENLVSFVRRFAEIWLTDSPLYNSLKHGLAVIPSDAVVLIDSHVMGEGNSLASLEYSKGPRGVRDWSLVTRWIDLQESLALIEVGQQMIGALWAIARARYASGSAEVVLYFPPLAPKDLRSAGAPVRRFRMSVLKTEPAPTDSD
jgi:hypothetical protein